MTHKQITIIVSITATVMTILAGFIGYTIGRTPPQPIIIQLQKHQ